MLAAPRNHRVLNETQGEKDEPVPEREARVDFPHETHPLQVFAVLGGTPCHTWARGPTLGGYGTEGGVALDPQNLWYMAKYTTAFFWIFHVVLAALPGAIVVALLWLVLPESAYYDVSSFPEGTQVFVDGLEVGRAPGPIRIPKGDHQLRLSLAGYHDFTTRLRVGLFLFDVRKVTGTMVAKSICIAVEPTSATVKVFSPAGDEIWSRIGGGAFQRRHRHHSGLRHADAGGPAELR